MEILLVRHGEPVTVVNESEPADPHLTERGSWQAERLAEWLAHEPIDAIVSSSKRRAIDTARPLCTRLAIQPELVPDLVEIDRLSRIYAPPPLLAERFPEYVEAIQKGDFESIGWDSYEDFQARVTRGWQDLVDRPRGDRVVVACHGGTIGVILSHLLGVSSHSLFDSTPYASVTRVLVVGEDARVRSLHETAHFDGVRASTAGWEGEGFPPA